MSKTILITGGVGFNGSHLVDEFLLKGHQIIVYDILKPQVHGTLVPCIIGIITK